MKEQKQSKELKVEIQLDDDVATGEYINSAVINFNDSEFVIDCLYIQPQAPKAKVRSRLITSPRHAKRLMLALQQNLSGYEKKYGEIKLEEAPASAGQEGPVH